MINKKFEPVRGRQHIILGFSRVNTLGLIRSLGREGIRPIVVTLPASRKTAPLIASKYLAEVHHAPSFDEGLDYIIERFGHEREKGVIHVNCDYCAQLCDRRYSELKDSFHVAHSESPGSLAKYFDKETLCHLAASCGLPVPACETVTRGNLPKSLRYPIFVKCRNSFGAWKSDMAICKSPEELMEAYNNLQSDEWLMQDYIDRQEEVSLQGISIRGGEQVYMPYKKVYIRLRDADYGTYMYYEPNDMGPEMLEGIKKMLRTIQFSGCFEIEFLRDKQGHLHFLEINLRYSASNQGMDCGGVNLPMEWALAAITGRFDAADIPLRTERYYVMNEVLDIPEMLLKRKITFSQWWRDFRKAKCCCVWDKHDMKPALLYAWCCISGKIARRLLSRRH